jgi:hypothetical protein
MVVCMRTTLDLPDDLLSEARELAAKERTTLTALLADGLRLRLRQPARRGDPRPLPTSIATGGMHPGIDPTSNASVLDAADGEDPGAAA